MIVLSDLEAIVFDFDGVLTDNKVYVNQDGQEIVCCHRSDGLAFDYLRKTNLKLFILSTETNSVVLSRGKKLKVPVLQGVKDKQNILKNISKKMSFNLENTLFIGNDINDYHAMKICGFSTCPSDSHPKILEIVTFYLKTAGGQGIVRELVDILQIAETELI
jgi:3-deoxy-D-manno-octulosonate 8-phosphate phosphatase (KDO 8-P phosphatase)